MSARAAGGARQAVAFLMPVGGAVRPGPEAQAWFPLVGVVIGAATGAVWWAAVQVWPAAVAAVMAVAADLALTGLLHMDGLCDAADGLLPPLERARRLAVMSTPEVGAFGVSVAVVVVGLRWAAFASVRPDVWLVAGLWAASRAGMALTMSTVPYARGRDGLASAFGIGGGRGAALAGLGVLGAMVIAAAWRPVLGPVSVLAGLVGSAAVVALAWRRLGGYTGDVLGAAGVVGETVGLLVACGRW